MTPGVNDATVRTLLAQAPGPRRRSRSCAKAARARRPRARRRAGCRSPSWPSRARRLVPEAASTSTAIDELGDDAPRRGREAARRATRAAASASRRSAAAAARASASSTTRRRCPALVREMLAEVKATGVGDNKNMLIELNIEQTRHNEIQMLGNGEWCVTLGGRDCSLQMHEQKLVEVSVTQEALRGRRREGARRGAQTTRRSRSRTDLDTLRTHGGRGRALRPRRQARLRVDLRVHRRGRRATTSWR